MVKFQKKLQSATDSTSHGYGYDQYSIPSIIVFALNLFSFTSDLSIPDFNCICLHTYFSMETQMRFLPDKFVGISFPTDCLLSNSTAQASGSYGYAQFGAGRLRGLL